MCRVTYFHISEFETHFQKEKENPPLNTSSRIIFNPHKFVSEVVKRFGSDFSILIVCLCSCEKNLDLNFCDTVSAYYLRAIS